MVQILNNPVNNNLNTTTQKAGDLIGILQNTNTILLIIVLSLLVILIILTFMYFLYWKKDKRLRVFIRGFTGQIEKYKTKIDNKEFIAKDGYPYLIDPLCIKDSLIEFYWHNPNPIRFNPMDQENLASIEEQNLKEFKEQTIIKEFLTASDFLGIIKILLIGALLVSAIGTSLGVIQYFHKTSDLSRSIETLNIIYEGSHMSAPINTTTAPKG
jgi:hypothetical protein